MKLSWKQIDPFVKSPDPKARVVLIYGPDDGLMRERAQLIGKTVVPDLSDPFNVTVLTADQISEDNARLSDEARAMSMMGGARLIRIDGASDKLTPVIKDYLDDASAENLVILEAGELGPRSSLRQLCEKAKNAAALPCYVEDERGIANLIREMLREGGYTINGDAGAWLAQNIAGDRLRARSEIEKLILYMGGEGGTVTLEDAQNACGAAGVATLDDFIYAVGAGQSAKALAAFDKLISDGMTEVVILRTLQNHFRRLHYTKVQVQGGTPVDAALKSLQPPIFFKYEQAFKGQMSRWGEPKLRNVLSRLADLEAQTKQTDTPVETLCSQAILAISAAA